MASMSGLDKLDREYVRSGRWKCDKSPTGAHHWVERSPNGIFICKWCFDVRRFPRTFDLALRWTYGKKTPNIVLGSLGPQTPRRHDKVPLRRKRRGRYGDD